MKYVGSKSRHAKELLPFLLEGRDSRPYVEPFCGSCSILASVSGQRIANDAHPYLIAMYRALQDGWEPPDEIDESDYQILKGDPAGFPPELVGFVGFACSYAAKWFGGYARGKASDGSPRNYCAEGKRNLQRQVDALRDVEFRCGDYRDVEIPPNSVVYCDPPYAGTTTYAGVPSFNHDEFWAWCGRTADKGHTVFVSEYTAPDVDSVLCVWEKTVISSLDLNTGGKQGIERLFYVMPSLAGMKVA